MASEATVAFEQTLETVASLKTRWKVAMQAIGCETSLKRMLQEAVRRATYKLLKMVTGGTM